MFVFETDLFFAPICMYPREIYSIIFELGMAEFALFVFYEAGKELNKNWYDSPLAEALSCA